MGSELVQTGFFDLEEVRNEGAVQVAYDYSRVTPEQADKLQTIYNRVLIRHMATAYEDGKDLLEARAIQGLPYKEFIAWAHAAYGWGESAVNDKMNIALRWGPITPTIGVIEDRARYLLSTKTTPEPARQEAKTLLDSGVDVNEELAKQLRDKHKADLEEAERAKKELQRQFDLFRESSQKELDLFKWEKALQDSERDAKLKKLEDDLKATSEEKEKIAQSKKETILQDTPETKAKLEQLDKDIKALEKKEKKLKSEKKVLSDEAKRLGDELVAQRDANEARRKQEEYEQQIKDQCKESNQAIQKAITQYVGHLPTSLASQIYTFDEWAMLDQTDKLLDYCKEAIAHARLDRYKSQFIDVNASSDLVVYEAQDHYTFDSIPIEQVNTPPPIVGIPDEHLELFTAYQQTVWSTPQPSLLWSAPDNNYTDQMREKGKHIQFTKELLRSGVDRRIRGAQEAMKRTLGIWEEAKV